MKKLLIHTTIVIMFANLHAEKQPFIQCADLSYVNEMLDAGVRYRSADGAVKEPYALFEEIGIQMVRVRLWHNPKWSEGYSTFEDVVRTIRSAKAAGMQVMLNFHYSDNWTDPGKQVVPSAWAEHVDDQETLGTLMYDYTVKTLYDLDALGLMPELVQIGNENDNGIMNAEPWSEGFQMDWERQIHLFNCGIRAVRDVSKSTKIQPKVIVHVAKSENLEHWFTNAFDAGLDKIDYIGVSFYTPWTITSCEQLGEMVNRWRHLFQTQVFVVEAAYPWTLLSGDDQASNMLGRNALQRGYKATTMGQLNFMKDLTQILITNGCAGLSYWEPAWLSSVRPTQWGIGSHWENAGFFDFRNGDNTLHQGASYIKAEYSYPANVEFIFTPPSNTNIKEIFFWGDFIGGNDFWIRLEQNAEGNFVYRTTIPHRTNIRFIALTKEPEKGINPLQAYEEVLHSVDIIEQLESPASIRINLSLPTCPPS